MLSIKNNIHDIWSGILYALAFLREVPDNASQSSAVDEKQRSPLLQFYLSALAFVSAFILTEYSPSPWRGILRVAMGAIAGFGVWALLRFLRVADERQRRINFRALRFAFIVGLVLSLFGGFVQGLAFFMFPGLVSSGSNSSHGASV
jgi:hypothetical protein